MRRFLALCIALVALALASSTPAQGQYLGVIPQSAAQQQGLKRAWFAQVELDRSRDKVQDMALDGGLLVVHTNHGLLHALNAETGGTLWIQQVGSRNHPQSNLALNGTHVAVISGSTLFVLDRRNGRETWSKRLEFVPGETPSMSADWVYVPAFDGNLEVYPLVAKKDQLKWNFSAFGRIEVPPLVARDRLVWATSKGNVYFCTLDRAHVEYRLETTKPISAPLSYWPPMVVAASRDGDVFAIGEKSQQIEWKFPVATAINEMPVALDGNVFVLPESGGMHCLSVEDGSVRWFHPAVRKFVSASPTRVYTADQEGNVLILDLKSGGEQGRLLANALPNKYLNTINDRLYLSSNAGVVLCLREMELASPTTHEYPVEDKKPKIKQNTDQGGAPAAPANDAFGQ